jgi:shikimate kinase
MDAGLSRQWDQELQCLSHFLYHSDVYATTCTMTSIFLFGPMCSGKSTVGRALARKLGYRFIDSDREIEARCGVDIPTIFDYEGEAGFRDREARIIDELTALPGIVLATGGGAILREENRQHLTTRGHVILLQVELKEQLRRVAFDASRPLLQTADPEARLRALMQEREPIYNSVADVAIPTDSRRMYHVVSRILRHLKKQGVSIDSSAEIAARGEITRPAPMPLKRSLAE